MQRWISRFVCLANVTVCEFLLCERSVAYLSIPSITITSFALYDYGIIVQIKLKKEDIEEISSPERRKYFQQQQN